MKRVLTALVLIPLVLLLVFRGPFWLITLAAAVVAELATWEYLDLADRSGAKTPRAAVLVAIGLLFACAFFRPEYMAALLGCLGLLLFLLCSFRSPLDRVLPDTAYSVFALVYLGLTLTTIPLLSAQENGASLLVLLFATVWTGDIAALYVGRSLGRHKLAPTISPKKTWEGSIASVAGSVLVAWLLLLLAAALSARGIDLLAFPGANSGQITRWLVLAGLLNVAAQLGDLVESALKRGAGVKDSGTLLPGHGGMLDRIDALLLAAPLLWYAQLAQQAF